MSACEAAYTGAKCSGMVLACSAEIAAPMPASESRGAVMLGITDKLPVGQRAGHHVGDEIAHAGAAMRGTARREMAHAVVHGPQFQVGDHGEVPLPAAHDGDERTYGHVFQRRIRRAVQPHVQAAGERAADDYAEPLQRAGVLSVAGSHAVISRKMACNRCGSRGSSAASVRPARSRNRWRSTIPADD